MGNESQEIIADKAGPGAVEGITRPAQPAMVLLIEDSAGVRERVQGALVAAQVTTLDALEVAVNGAEGIRKLNSLPRIDLVLCDLHMPDLDGLKFLSLKSSVTALQSVPVIMLTGEGQLQTKLQCLAAGASDYMTKPFHDEELVARVRIHLQLKQLRDQLEEKNILLQALSRTDVLTGVPNRRCLMEEAAREFSRADRGGCGLGLVMLDIDHFKWVNDTYGHQGGDRVLRQVAEVLRQSLRGHDQIGRYGGEEFVLLLPDTTAEGARLTAERCRRLVRQTSVEFDGQTIGVTASFGVSHYSCTDRSEVSATLEHLLSRADEALYDAKDRGRDCVRLVRYGQAGEKLVSGAQAV